MKHFRRWEVVSAYRQAGFSRDDASAKASKKLKGTVDCGEPPAMKYSYELVERDWRDGRASRYFMLLGKRHREPGSGPPNL